MFLSTLILEKDLFWDKNNLHGDLTTVIELKFVHLAEVDGIFE